MKISIIPFCSLLLVCSALLLGMNAHAQQPVDSIPGNKTGMPGALQITEVVVTGQYSANSPDKAVQRIKIIDRAKIDAMSAQNLRDVLSNELNIRLSQDNLLGSSLSVQDISGQNVKILVDGVPVIGRQDGNIDLSQVNLGNIERIEIIEGPMSVNYGTNAIAGTINLITKKTQRALLETGLSSYYESTGTYNINFRAGMHQKKHTLSLTGGRNFFDGWNNGDKITLDFKPRIADSSRFQQWKPRAQYMAGGQYQFKAGSTTLNYKANYFNEKISNLGMPLLPYGENAFDDYYYTTRIDNAFFLNSILSRNRNLNFLIAYNIYQRIKNTYYDDLTTLNRQLTANPGDQDTSKFQSINSRSTYGTSKTSAKINYEIGYDINVENAVGARIKDRQQQIGDYAAFASIEYKPMEQLTIRPGFRYGYNTAYNAPLTPSLNVRYKALDNLVLRGSYAKGFRSPSLKELYLFFVDINHDIRGNEALKPEYSDNYSLSALFTHNTSRFNLRVDAASFYNDIRDLMTLALVSGAEYSYINIGKYKTKGLQVNAEVAVKALKIYVGGTYTGTYNGLSETQNVTPFTYSPELRCNVFYAFKKQGITAALFYKYSGRMIGFTTDLNNNVLQTYIDAYSTADITLSKLLFEKRINLSVGSKNLFDVKNIASSISGGAHNTAGSSIPMNCGRLYFIKMDINLKSRQ